MIDPLPFADHEQMLETFRERNEQFISAGRRTQLEFLETMEKALGAFADAREQLADASDVEWVSRLCRAQANFTRDVADASSKFARQLLDV